MRLQKAKTQIDFYILANNPHDTVKSSPLMVSCLLIEKAYHLHHKIFVLSQNQSQSQQIDDLLWKFKQNSFIPHSTDLNSDDAVIIGEQMIENCAIVVNLCDKVIDLNKYKNINRVLEIVASSAKSLGREKYKHYQNHQEKYALELKVHQL